MSEISRRQFVEILAVSGASLSLGTVFPACRSVVDDFGPRNLVPIDVTSRYGRWWWDGDFPVFVYTGDQERIPEAEWDPVSKPPTRRHFHLIGNRSISVVVDNYGTSSIWDESEGMRWLVAPDHLHGGSGVTVLKVDGKQISTQGSGFVGTPGRIATRRTFGPTWFTVETVLGGVRLERTVLCPEGERPWVLVRVRLTLSDNEAPKHASVSENWVLRPRFISLPVSDKVQDGAARQITFDVTKEDRRIVAHEQFNGGAFWGTPAILALEALGATGTAAAVFPDPNDGTLPNRALRLAASVKLQPGKPHDLWFRFGKHDTGQIDDPAALFQQTLDALKGRLPRVEAAEAPHFRHEAPWHAAVLTGQLCADKVLGGHTLDQGSAYSHEMGFNAAARDPMQHALPLIYIDPAMALSVLRNTCSWGSPDGDLPWSIGRDKKPDSFIFRPSDQNLWVLWMAAEYAAVTGNLGVFNDPVGFHPVYSAAPLTLKENLILQYRFFRNHVGRGARNHVRILSGDWNDVAIRDSGSSRSEMIANGSSVLNSAMAAWVLPVFAGLMDRLSEPLVAADARLQAEELRTLVASAWNGRWFQRAYTADGTPVGEQECYLEVQPWALLCGAATNDQALALLGYIDTHHRKGSPLGARIKWPTTTGSDSEGGIWYSINMTLIWAASRYDPAMAWDEFRRMSLSTHTREYGEIWEGTLSGPDTYNSPEAKTPGRTWSTILSGMQAFPVGNLHAHAQPLFCYLRLLGIEPTAQNALRIGRGGLFKSPVFGVGADGHGTLEALGPVTLETVAGRIKSEKGLVTF